MNSDFPETISFDQFTKTLKMVVLSILKQTKIRALLSYIL